MNGEVPERLADHVRRSSREGEIVELVSGEVVNRAAPPAHHELIVARLYERLSKHVDQHDLGVVFRLPWPLELSKFDVVRPDIYFTSLENTVVEPDAVRGAPELVIEVVSPETRERDLGEKKRLYQWSGVAEYWLIDPDAETFEAMTRGKQTYDLIPIEGELFRSLLLPGFELGVQGLFSDLA